MILTRIFRRTPQAAARPFTIELTDRRSVVAHRVTVKAFAAGRVGAIYQAICGALVTPVRLTAPARSHCPTCERGV